METKFETQNCSEGKQQLQAEYCCVNYEKDSNLLVHPDTKLRNPGDQIK